MLALYQAPNIWSRIIIPTLQMSKLSGKWWDRDSELDSQLSLKCKATGKSRTGQFTMLNSNFMLIDSLHSGFRKCDEVMFGKMQLGVGQACKPSRKESPCKRTRMQEACCSLQGRTQCWTENIEAKWKSLLLKLPLVPGLILKTDFPALGVFMQLWLKHLLSLHHRLHLPQCG